MILYMSHFWQKRSAQDDFSIEKLAKSYRARLSEFDSDSKGLLPKETASINKEDLKNNLTLTSPVNIDKIVTIHSNHWANRDFKEYYHVA